MTELGNAEAAEIAALRLHKATAMNELRKIVLLADQLRSIIKNLDQLGALLDAMDERAM